MIDHAELHPIVAQTAPSAEQLPAVMTRGVDILVSAGAGSGKTRTLTARILALLAEGLPLRSIVAVTFTIKAASEVRNRLRREIQTFLATGSGDPEERQRWSAISAEIDAARIGTIHSLCSEILRFNAAEAGIDPAFAVLDESRSSLLRRAAIEEALRHAASHAEYAPLIEALRADELADVLKMLLSDQARGEAALDIGNEHFIEWTLAKWGEQATTFVNDEEAREAIHTIRLALAEAETSERAATDALLPVLAQISEVWERAEAAVNEGRQLDALAELAYLGSLPRNRGRKDSFRSGDPKGAVLLLKDLYRSRVPLPEKVDPRADLALMALLPLLRDLHGMALARYTEEKEAARALDFDDLERLAHRLLVENAGVREEWRERVQALLVDEFQDTNARQRDLVRAIAGDRGILFMVGDAKQSIYRFRGGDVRVFRQERAAVEEGAGVAATLERSFRAHPPLLGSLNRLLAHALDDPYALEDDAPPPEYIEPFAPLSPGDETRAPAVGEPWIEVQLGVGTKSSGALTIAADALAVRLRELHNAGVRWEEMAVLCRRARAFAEYEDAFERHAIPYVTTAGAGFHERPEVRDLLNVLHAIADPNDNLALAGLLRSPVVGMSDADLLTLRHTLGSQRDRSPAAPGTWWRALQRQTIPGAAQAVALIESLHHLAGRVPVSELLAAVLEATHYEAILLAAGNQRGARNLAKLLEDAQRTPDSSVRTFLAAIEELASAGARSGEAQAESAGSVQIMTVHAAKGLEFPVVVLGDAGGRPGGGSNPGVIDERQGLLLPLAQEDGRKSLLHTIAQEQEWHMEEMESGRLLYVAATRARELLILNGVAKINERGNLQVDGWLKRLAPALGFDLPVPDDLMEVVSGATSANSRVYAPVEGVRCTLHWRSPAVADDGDAATDPAEISRSTPSAQGSETSLANPPLLEPLKFALRAQPEEDERVLQSVRNVLTRALSYQTGEPAPRARYTRAPQAVVGSIVHAALEIGLQPDDARFDGWLQRQLDNYDLAEGAQRRNAATRASALLHRYYASDLHREVQQARVVYRELPYATLVASQQEQPQMSLFAGNAAPEGAPRRENGRIDLLYQRADGRWALVDFKIDRITGRVNALKQITRDRDYLEQIRRYGRAVAAGVGEMPLLQLCLMDDHGALTVHVIAPS